MIRKFVQMGAALAVVLGLSVLINPQGGAAYAQDVDTSSIVEMTIGDENAPIEMIEYASFTCPHCGSFHLNTLKDIKKNYIDTGKVKLVYREVYFDRVGLWGSMVARCGGPEKFFGVVDLIYQGQSEWLKSSDPSTMVDELRKIGRLAGIEEEKLQACLTDADKAQTLIAWYQENADKHGIDATPSFIINGEKVSNMSYRDFAAYLDAELAKQ